MAKKQIKDTKNKEDQKLLAFVATFLSIVGFLIILLTKNKDKYVRFYARQSLVVFIAALILGIISSVFLELPIIGKIIYFACSIVSIVLWVLSWVHALSGEEKEVALVGSYADKISFK